jgi:hypothetical protein
MAEELSRNADLHDQSKESHIMDTDRIRWSADLLQSLTLRVDKRLQKYWANFSAHIPKAASSKAWVCGRSFAGTTGSNPTDDIDVCLFRALCVVKKRTMRRADHSSRGVLPSVVYECDRETSIIRKTWPTRGCCAMGKKNSSHRK